MEEVVLNQKKTEEIIRDVCVIAQMLEPARLLLLSDYAKEVFLDQTTGASDP
jgi:hypothetical protein